MEAVTSIRHDVEGAGAMASPSPTRSLRIVHDARQKGGATTRRLSRLHGVGVRVRVDPEGTEVRGFSTSETFIYLLLKTGAGFGRRPFQPHSHWPLLPAADRRLFNSSLLSSRHPLRVCAVTGCTSPLIALRSPGCNRPSANPLPNQQLVNAFADRSHVQAVLSSSLISSGIDPNEIGLTEWTSILCSRSKNL